MAKIEMFDSEFDTNVLMQLFETDSEELCEEMLNESAPFLEDSIKKELRANLYHDGDSELIDSISAGTAQKTKDGSAFIVNVTPKGYSQIKVYIDKRTRGHERKIRRYKVSNALKAIWKEYGIPGKQVPSPFFEPARRKAEKQVLAKMQEVYERKTGIK